MPKKENITSAVATIVGDIKKHPLDGMRHVMFTDTHEVEERGILLGISSKPYESSSKHSQDVS